MPKTQPLIITGQSIPGWAWGQWKKRYGVDETCRMVYRANVKGAKSYFSWIKGGLPSKKHPDRKYALEPCFDEYNNPTMVKSWIDMNILKFTPEPVKETDKTDPQGLGDILDNILKEEN